MFEDADAFNQDLSAWDTSSVTYMGEMFNHADAFDQDLSGLEVTNAGSMNGMLDNSGMSVDNYDATLNGWYQQALTSGVQPNVTLGAEALLYSSAGQAARDALINDFGWTIEGDALWDGAANRDPNAIIDFAEIAEGASSAVFNVLANDRDQDGDTLTVTSASAVHGSVTIEADGRLNYTPGDWFPGVDGVNNYRDTITYTVSDGNGGTDTATMSVTVSADNDVPSAQDDSGFETEAGDALTLQISDLLANDSDPDDDDLIFSAFMQPENGTIEDNGDGSLTYTPDESFLGEDSFGYTIMDELGGSDTANVTMNVFEDEVPTTNPAESGSDDDDDDAFGGVDLLLLIGLGAGLALMMGTGGIGF